MRNTFYVEQEGVEYFSSTDETITFEHDTATDTYTMSSERRVMPITKELYEAAKKQFGVMGVERSNTESIAIEKMGIVFEGKVNGQECESTIWFPTATSEVASWETTPEGGGFIVECNVSFKDILLNLKRMF